MIIKFDQNIFFLILIIILFLIKKKKTNQNKNYYFKKKKITINHVYLYFSCWLKIINQFNDFLLCCQFLWCFPLCIFDIWINSRFFK